MTIDDYIAQRNEIQLSAEPGNEWNKIANRYEAWEFASRAWGELGVANRHIERVLDGTLRLNQCEKEIVQCLERVREWIITNCQKSTKST